MLLMVIFKIVACNGEQDFNRDFVVWLRPDAFLLYVFISFYNSIDGKEQGRGRYSKNKRFVWDFFKLSSHFEKCTYDVN